jgi:hypothetical protein
VLLLFLLLLLLLLRHVHGSAPTLSQLLYLL